MEKHIDNMLHLVNGDISNKKELKRKKIDVIVNAANPTLMGSNQGVDGAIHEAIDKRLASKGSSFNKEIRKELNEKKNSPEQQIRCQRGKAVLTEGYGLCPYVMHVVGAEFDGKSNLDKRGNYISCSSSHVRKLEECYYEIVRLLKEHSDIKNVAIPIISSGEYGFPFLYAAEIAIASIGNALVEWREQDAEMFNYAGIENIYFYVCGKSINDFRCTRNLLDKYKKIFACNKKVVYQSSVRTHFQMMNEIRHYDLDRGYFAIAKGFRLLLIGMRTLFLPFTVIKDWRGKNDWQKRRSVVEIITIVKILLPFIAYMVLKLVPENVKQCVEIGIGALLIYCLADTVTYLFTLIFLADIQKPSANIIRSMILLFVNYLEVSLDMAVLCLIWYGKSSVMFRKAVAWGILGESIAELNGTGLVDYAFRYANAGLKFFFVTLVFGYFAGHMKQRKFRS